jgi:predicted permease
MEKFLIDLRYGFRMLIKNPGFTSIAIIALALGIGANSSIFSVINAVLLRPLPFKDSDRVVVVNETVRRETLEIRPASYPDYKDWREQNTVFEEITSYAQQSLSLTDVSEPERIDAEIVSASYFPLLGIQASVGRTFLPEEDANPDTHPVAIVSSQLWKRRFGSDPALVGKTIKLNYTDFTVVGIIQEGFTGVSGNAEIWIPMMMVSTVYSKDILNNRGSRWHSVIARLKPDVSIEQAQTEMSTIASRIEQAYPDSNKDRGVEIVGAQEAVVGDIRPMLLVLLGTVGFVLLIACANVANLQLARAATRQKEVAVRSALGASRMRIIRQLLTENIILSLIGGSLGLLIAVWGVELMTTFLSDQIPQYLKINIDLGVLFFTLLLSLLTGIIFGLAPALSSSRPNLNELLKEGGKGSGTGSHRSRLRKIFVITEVALSLMLLIGAVLMLKSFQKLQAFNPGFKVENLLTSRISLKRDYPLPQIETFNQQLIENIKALPSVQSIALASDVPLGGNSSAILVDTESESPEQNGIRVYRHSISTDFFSTMNIPIIKGRDFTVQDSQKSPNVVIISEAMSRRYWPDSDSIGKRIRVGKDKDGKPNWVEIVGVTGDVKYRTLIRDQNRDPDIYFPLLQSPTRNLAIVVRTSTDPANLVSSLRNKINSIDPNLPVFAINTMDQLMKDQTLQSRLTAILLSIFALMALVLASIGIYGVISYSATQRTHEIGIRMAIGAQRVDILKLIVKEGMLLVLIGITLGLFGAFFTTRLISGQLYSVSATDLMTFMVVPFILSVIALLACYIPARRATRVDPMVALRYE